MPYYIDQGAYPTYSLIPTALNANGAQDGDGLLPGLAKSAVASIDIQSVATGVAIFTVLGVSLTATASGATTTQFNIGANTTVQATNIAAAINAATGQVPTTVSVSRHQLKNMVYAWASGTVVNVMTRAGSANFNFATNSACNLATGNWSGHIITPFAGGVSGAWGYLASDNATIWPTSIAKNQYGVGYAATGVAPLALTSALTADSFTWIRANNNTLTLSTTANVQLMFTAKGTFMVDDGTVWSGDTGFFKVQATGATPYIASVSSGVGCDMLLSSKQQSRFIIETSNTQPLFLCGNVSASGLQSFTLDNVTLSDTGTASAYIQILNSVGASVPYNGADLSFTRVKHTVTGNKFYSLVGGIALGSINNLAVVIDDFYSDFSYYTGTPAVGFVGSLAYLGATGGAGTSLVIRNGTVKVTNKPFLAVTAIPSGASFVAGNRFVAENISGVLPFATIGIFGSVTPINGPEENYVCRQQGIGTARQFKLETNSSVVTSDTTLGYPTLDSAYYGGQQHSLGIQWAGTAMPHCIRKRKGTELYAWAEACVVENSSIVEMELLFEPAVASVIDSSYLVMSVAYIGTDDLRRVERTFWHSSTATVLPTGSSAWTLNDYPTYVAEKLALQLSANIKLNTELDITLFAYKTAPVAVSSLFFVNPEVTIR